MKLTEQQSQRVLRTHGSYLTEVSDKCGALLGAVRWTIRGESGTWRSRACRDGADHQPRVCRGCGVSLAGMRKHAKYCSDVCRKRQRIRDIRKNPEMPIADKGLADAISVFGRGGTIESADCAQQSPNANEAHS
jgi:hypothetical protein